MILLLLACEPDEPVDSGLAPTLVNVQAEVFTASCAFSTCHGDGGGNAGLSLLDGLSYSELVAIPAEGDEKYGPPPEGAIRVVPGDPDASYLVTKLSGEGDYVGTLMPGASGLDAERLELVRQWISEGAQDN